MAINKMTHFRCFLLTVSFHSCPPFTTAQYIPDELLPSISLDKRVERLSQAVYHFTTDLHRTIFESNISENVFFSPTSVYLGFAMLYTGSGGNTKSQLASALHLDVFESDESEFYENIKILYETMNTTNKNYPLEITNRLFMQKEFEIKEEYLRIIGKYFSAELEALDFVNDPSGSKSKINRWVSGMTSENINEHFPSSAITNETILALANTVFFNGSWLRMFEEDGFTTNETFTTSRDEKIKVPTMRIVPFLGSRGFRYSESHDKSFRLLELPYSDENVSMIIALGDRNSGFDTFVRGRVANSSWDQLVDTYSNILVRLTLPTFSLQHTLNLKNILSDLGIENLFENADLSGITDSRPVELSEAIHKAYVDVNEEGTQAAASKGLGIQKKSKQHPSNQVILFYVDRPFVFLVVEKRTGCILLFGHIQNPLKSN